MIRKRSVSIDGHGTSVSLEDEFWAELKASAVAERTSLAALIARIDRERGTRHALSSALRLHVLQRLKAQTAENDD